MAAFDPNAISKDLRPVNVPRNLSDDPHIALSAIPTTSGRAPDVFHPNPVVQHDTFTSPPSVAPVYYTDASALPGLGFVSPPAHITAQIPTYGYAYSPSPSPSYAVARPTPTPTTTANNYIPTGTSSTPSASEEGGQDSVSGRKVKFLCSFGGKILPRPSDGALRYVGGQTKIISVRQDVTYPEVVQKMVDTYGQPVTIKYQLPFEDLDALVSVSCSDDLDNMMEEYQKLLESSPDGSVKLRVFLFSASELDPTGLVQFGDFQDSGHRYVDAVNGIGEGFGGGITRKESIASGASTQNSDMSGLEVLDAAICQDAFGASSMAMFSPTADSASPRDNALRLEASVPPVIVPVAAVPPISAPTQPVINMERNVPPQAHLQQPLQGYEFPPPPPSPYLAGYADPQRDAFSGIDYQKLQPQVVYANHQVMGALRPIVFQPQYRDNDSMMTQPFISAVQMNVSPASSNLSMNPNIVQPIAQAQAPRVVAVPPDQTYINAYSPQVSGGYGWPQSPSPDHVPYSVPNDCYMCQKALPHAHSDTIVQNQKNSHSPMVSDTNPIYHSLRLDDISRIHVAPLPPNQDVTGLTANILAPAMGNVNPSLPEDAINHHFVASSQPVQEPLGSKPVNVVSSPVGNVTYQISEQYSPKTSMDNCYIARPAISHDNARHVEFVRENFQTKPSNVLLVNEHNKSPTYQYIKDDLFEQGTPQVSEIETMPNVSLTMPAPTAQPVQHVKQPMAGETVGALNPFEGLLSNSPVVDITSPSNDPRDDATLFSTGVVLGNVTSNTNVNPLGSPHDWGAVSGDSTENSLFSNQDPWNMLMPESHYPPPKPTKFTMRRESSAKELHGSETNLNKEAPYSDGGRPTLEQVQTSKGSAEDHIKQQLQATAEGVAASVLHSSVPSNADSSSVETGASVSEPGHEMEGQNSDAQIQTKMEALKIKPEKANLGFPMSDSKGRLQIIENSDLEELRELGSGTFGTVFHGKWKGTDVAIKRIKDSHFTGKNSEQERLMDDFWNEAIKLADLHHPNVVAFYGVVLDGPGGSVATVTEYMVNGSLRTALQKNERNLDKRKRLLIAMDVAFGMEYLHSKKIVHFDLKSDNLLVNLRDPTRPVCKVGDLGLSKVKCQTFISGGVRGTLPWMAPELLNGSSSLVSEKVDVFSFGIVMWELLTGEEPYGDLHYGAIIGGIVSNTLRPAVPENCDPNWRTLMERCWSAEPPERPNFTEIASELRSMSSKLPSKAQTLPSTIKPTV